MKCSEYVSRAERPAAGGVDQRRDVELAERLPYRVPEAVTKRGRLLQPFIGVRVDHRAHEAVLGDAAAQLVHPRGGGGLHRLRQPSDALEPPLDLAGQRDRQVRLLGEPLDDLGGRLAVHHLVRPRRDQLEVNTRVVQVLAVGEAAEAPVRRVQCRVRRLRRQRRVAATVRAAVRDQARLVHVQAVGGRDMPMDVDLHVSAPFRSPAGAPGISPAPWFRGGAGMNLTPQRARTPASKSLAELGAGQNSRYSSSN